MHDNEIPKNSGVIIYKKKIQIRALKIAKKLKLEYLKYLKV